MRDRGICRNYLKPSWNNTEKTRPKARWSCSGTTAYQSIDDSSREMSQKKALAIRIIILMGSAAMVKVNMASGGPKARKAQPKKSITVIFPLVSVARVLVDVSLSPFPLFPFRLVRPYGALANARPSCEFKKPLRGSDTPFYRAHLSSRCGARSGTRQTVAPVRFTKIQKPTDIGINRRVTRVSVTVRQFADCSAHSCVRLSTDTYIDDRRSVDADMRDRYIDLSKVL